MEWSWGKEVRGMKKSESGVDSGLMECEIGEICVGSVKGSESIAMREGRSA